ncbi:uncharacterized protein LOC131430481 isoform X2 [Malaya genurostris]|uniref:uncharacterized protein LOC131430481 isoform X2 n=1 Tax=Malaya genurostris TaxID=325434 RepID=UPI0026F3BDE1|nr:uncharacterized protein LOC131430481 isoform X2 [Malaya genurostris]
MILKSGAGLAGFSFPLATERDIEALELAVRQNTASRDQYDYKSPRMDVANVFTDLFSDEALANYNYFGMTNRSRKKKAMRDYVIFTDCMLEAWESHGIGQDVLREKITKVIARLNHKLRTRRYRSKTTAL